MVDAPVVAVRGEVLREAHPELATFTVTVYSRDKDRQATLSRLTARADGVRRMLDEHAAVIERVETGSVSVFPETKRSGERITAYSGSVSATVTVTDFTALGELMLRLSDADQTSVYGPSWSLRPDSPVYREARHAAIDDALVRAREYAEAVGASLTRLIELADVGLSDGAQPFAAQGFAMRAMAAPGGPPELELSPQRQLVRAQVEARFAISEPTRLG